MSYEGRVQQICAMGHCWETGEPYTWDEMDSCCPICKSKSVFANSVDDTNGNEVGVILPEGWKSLLLTPEVVETCNLGHKHITKEATYRVPTEDELTKLQHWWDYNAREYRRCDES